MSPRFIAESKYFRLIYGMSVAAAVADIHCYISCRPQEEIAISRPASFRAVTATSGLKRFQHTPMGRARSAHRGKEVAHCRNISIAAEGVDGDIDGTRFTAQGMMPPRSRQLSRAYATASDVALPCHHRILLFESQSHQPCKVSSPFAARCSPADIAPLRRFAGARAIARRAPACHLSNTSLLLLHDAIFLRARRRRRLTAGRRRWPRRPSCQLQAGITRCCPRSSLVRHGTWRFAIPVFMLRCAARMPRRRRHAFKPRYATAELAMLAMRTMQGLAGHCQLVVTAMMLAFSQQQARREFMPTSRFSSCRDYLVSYDGAFSRCRYFSAIRASQLRRARLQQPAFTRVGLSDDATYFAAGHAIVIDILLPATMPRRARAAAMTYRHTGREAARLHLPPPACSASACWSGCSVGAYMPPLITLRCCHY